MFPAIEPMNFGAANAMLYRNYDTEICIYQARRAENYVAPFRLKRRNGLKCTFIAASHKSFGYIVAAFLQS